MGYTQFQKVYGALRDFRRYLECFRGLSEVFRGLLESARRFQGFSKESLRIVKEVFLCGPGGILGVSGGLMWIL